MRFFYLVFSISLLISRTRALASLFALFIGLYVLANLGFFAPSLNEFWANSIFFEFLFGIVAYELFVRYRPGTV